MNSEKKTSVVITQSNYIPWKGYFDQINSCETFIYYDCVQYTRRDWRNRNQIKTPQGLKWLTIPVNSKGNFANSIDSIRVSNHEWAEQHWEALRHNYRRADCFGQVEDFVRTGYESVRQEEYLSAINKRLIESIASFLKIQTRFRDSSEFNLQDGKTARLVGLVEDVGGNNYISGPAAQSYLDEASFTEKNISVEWFDYSGYQPYNQLHGDFVHGVSILDLLFAVGDEAWKYIWKTS
jgi:hypothetical protein